jgi:hypothetical protein
VLWIDEALTSGMWILGLLSMLAVRLEVQTRKVPWSPIRFWGRRVVMVGRTALRIGLRILCLQRRRRRRHRERQAERRLPVGGHGDEACNRYVDRFSLHLQLCGWAGLLCRHLMAQGSDA